MPRLRVMVEVGICAGYGDGDYAIHISEIESLSIADMNELRRAFCVAIAQTERYWQDAQWKRPDHQAAQEAKATPTLLSSNAARESK